MTTVFQTEQPDLHLLEQSGSTSGLKVPFCELGGDKSVLEHCRSWLVECRSILFLVPGHLVINGNERADELKIEGASSNLTGSSNLQWVKTCKKTKIYVTRPKGSLTFEEL